MLRAILNKSWWQHPTRHQVYGHLPPITKTIQVRRTRHAGHCWRSISDVLLWTLACGRAKVGRPARTYNSSVRLRDVALKTCQKRWMIGRSGERGSGISMLAAQHDDIYIYIYILVVYVIVIYPTSTSSSSNDYTGFFDSLSTSIPIIHHFLYVLSTESNIYTEML